MSLTLLPKPRTSKEYRHLLAAGNKFILKESDGSFVFQLKEDKNLPGLYILHSNDQPLLNHYYFITDWHLHRVSTTGGIANTHDTFYSDIQFII